MHHVNVTVEVGTKLEPSVGFAIHKTKQTSKSTPGTRWKGFLSGRWTRMVVILGQIKRFVLGLQPLSFWNRCCCCCCCLLSLLLVFIVSIPTISGKNITVEDSFIQNFDDAVAVKTTTSAGKYSNCSEDIVVRNMVRVLLVLSGCCWRFNQQIHFSVGATIGRFLCRPLFS